MKCQVCDRKDATVHSTEIEGAVKRVTHLCEDCAHDAVFMTWRGMGTRSGTRARFVSSHQCYIITQYGLEATGSLKIGCPYCGTASNADPEFRCPECGATGRRDAQLESKRKRVCFFMERGAAPKRKAQE